jgi:Zn-dependent protease
MPGRGLYHPTGWYNPHTMLDLSLPSLITGIITLVIAFTAHEFAHAWTADQLGDDTPRLNQRLTLNPLAHLDPLGSLLLLIVGFGWAKPVPVNPYALRRRTPAGMMLVSVAGPFSNLLLAIVAALPFRMGLISPFATSSNFIPSASYFLIGFIGTNLVLLFFNLIPIYPLDGEKVLEYLLPPSGQDILTRIRPYGQWILLGLIFMGRFVGLDLLGVLIRVPAETVLSLLVL